MTSLLTYIVKGDPRRRSRLHNHKGDRIDARGLVYLPHSVITTIGLKLTNRRPDVPWLGYRAIRYLDELIEPSWRILEFGSGASTIWFARRCAFVLSLETDERWFEDVDRRIEHRGLDNVDLRLCRVEASGAPNYSAAIADHAVSEFDLVLVDGYRRDLAMETAIEAVRPGAYIFLDNTDLPNEDCRIAKGMLLEASGSDPQIKVFNDLCPTIVMVNEGTLARMPGTASNP